MGNDYDFSQLWRSDGTEAGTVLIKDVEPESSEPSHVQIIDLTSVNGSLVFTSSDDVAGFKLWRSDGTKAGTRVTKEFPRVIGSFQNPRFLPAVNGVLFFQMDDGVHGTELWQSDGTAAGTVLVKDINPGSGHSAPANLTNVNGTLFFLADDGIHGTELWRSDGTAAGTALVKDIRHGLGGSDPRNLIDVNGTLFFQADDGTHGWELWKSDGTDAGTLLVKDIRAAGNGLHSYAETSAVVNGTLFFKADDGIHGSELWKSDGTRAGTVLVRDLFPGNAGSKITGLKELNGTLLFGADDGVAGSELWKSDGTEAGTALVRDIRPGAGASLATQLASVDGTLYFQADDGKHGRELWKSDGSEAGTVLVKDINLGTSSNVRHPVSMNGKLYFRSDDGIHGEELWVSDGTAAGTVLVKDIYSGSRGSGLQELTRVNETLFFRAVDDTHQIRLWKSDGTKTGTAVLTDSHAYFDSLTSSNGKLFFVQYDSVHGVALWKSDGTKAGTVLVKDIYRDPSARIRHLTDVEGTLFFAADDGVHGLELWKSDGTEAGTVLVKDIVRGDRGSFPGSLVNVGGKLYFVAGDSLWKSDGTERGTVLIKDFLGPSTPAYASLTAVNGTLFFATSDRQGSMALWKSDGTRSGTVELKSFHTRVRHPVACLTEVNGALFFCADDGIHGQELWKSDGTEAGTVLVKDIARESSWPRYLTDLSGALFFRATDEVHGDELWMSDGTEAGTAVVSDHTIVGGSAPSFLTSVDGVLFMAARDDLHGEELWAVRDNQPNPTVEAVSVNGHGNSNRSGIRELMLEFDRPVTVRTASSLQIFNHTNGFPADISAATLTGNGTTQLTWDLSGITLPDGYYTVELPNSEAHSARGARLNATHAYMFHALAGDSTGDAKVDSGDFIELATNFNFQDGPGYGPGDLDGNGDVDFGDFHLLTSSFTNTLATPSMDFGDAPETATSYPVTAANQGARHLLGSGLFLGANADSEADGQPNRGATGDDNTGGDEDGVVFTALRPGTDAAVTIMATVPDTAVVNAWIDFNADGDWEDKGEQIFVDQALANGVNNLSVTVPDGAVLGATFARFRVTSVGGYDYYGLAADGEVEDYLVTLTAADSPGVIPLRLASARSMPIVEDPPTVASQNDEGELPGISQPLQAWVVDLAMAQEERDIGWRSSAEDFLDLAGPDNLVAELLPVDAGGHPRRYLR